MQTETIPEVDIQTEIQKALRQYFDALRKLRELGIAPNSKDFTCQIGEWLVEQLFNGKRATNGIQKDWDVFLANGHHVQVKSHAKAPTTMARWSPLRYDPQAEIDEVIIAVFNQQYQLREFYKAPWEKVLPRIRRHTDLDRIFWDDLKDFRISLSELPRQDVLKAFK